MQPGTDGERNGCDERMETKDLHWGEKGKGGHSSPHKPAQSNAQRKGVNGVSKSFREKYCRISPHAKDAKAAKNFLLAVSFETFSPVA